MPIRRKVNKARSARNFRKSARRTKRVNVARPMRGGIRM